MPAIINSDDGVVSGSSGLKTSGANDGITVFQQNGTEAMRIDSSGNITVKDKIQFGIDAQTHIQAGGTSDVDLIVAGDTNIRFETATNERMRIDSSGNVGIGTTSPVGKVESKTATVAGGSADYAQKAFVANIPYSTTNVISSLLSGWDGSSIHGVDVGYTYNGTGYNLIFSTNDNTSGNPIERARIDSSGNLLVGKTNASEANVGTAFGVGGDSYFTRSGSTNSNSTLHVYSTGAGAFRFYVGMGGTVYATSTTITAISDQRLKENIQDIDAGLAQVLALKPRKFDWKEGKGKNKKGDRGWIAQEFEQVFPDMIDEWRDPAPEGEEPYKAVNADLIPVLVKAIQEIKAELDATKAEVAALKAAAK